MTAGRTPPGADVDRTPPDVDATQRRRRSRLGRWRDQGIALGGLTVIWNLLWGEFTWGNLAAGILVAAAVLAFFPLPRVTFGGRIRPWAVLIFAVTFIVELFTASVHVAWVAVRPWYQPRGAVIGVQLAVRTDLNLTLTAEAVSLVPGTLILEIDRAAGILYVHVLDIQGPSHLEDSRKRVRLLEHRIVRAVGSDAELRQVEIALEGVLR